MLSLAKLLSKSHALDTLTTQLGLYESDRSKVIYDKFQPSSGGGHLLYKRYFGYPNLTFSPSTLVWLQKEVKNYDLAILHGVWNFPVMVAAHVCQQQRVPYVVFPHGTLGRQAIEMRSADAKHFLLNLCVQRNLERAARVVLSTQGEVKKISDHLGFKFTPFVMPNIVEASDFASLPARGSFRARYGIAATTQVLVHYGRIARVKGIEFAVKAVAALRRQGRDVVLLIVGGDDEGHKAKVQAVASDLGVGDALIFTGLLGRQEGLKALIDADVFVLPSYSENFGMAVVEAMLCHLPVVVSENVGLAEDLVRADVGVKVPLESDASSLTKALAALLDDKARREWLGQRGRQFAIENYDVPAVQARIAQLVSDAAGSVCS